MNTSLQRQVSCGMPRGLGASDTGFATSSLSPATHAIPRIGATRARGTGVSSRSALACCAVLAMLAVVLLPDAAFAWGPGVHMVAAHWLLQNASLLPAAVGSALLAHPDAFLYGSLSADIFIGKGCTVTPGHSHNWSTGHALYEAADTPRLHAYACGYLAHLAADTVAHNHYVPTLLGGTPGTGKLSHVYVEMQADRMVEWDAAEAASLFRLPNGAADRTLLQATHGGHWPFAFKKRLFRSSLAVSGKQSWRRSLGLVHRVMPHAADRAYLRDMIDVSVRAVVDVLRDPYGSAVTGIDPIGSDHLAEARDVCRGVQPMVARRPGGARFPLDERLVDLPYLPVPCRAA
ncbi:zinc dependent phospholipase C family protein [Nitratidesulfovibrio sp.]|uniref:zinc dependent phospholipase C family protein n=1 Tax=Nitratidesulfovibrio sp. TaxID=2802297 RepID=UPI00333E6286